MANSYEISTATFRLNAANVNSAIWPDAEIDSLGERTEAQAHQKINRNTPYDKNTETQKYKAFQQILIDGVAGTILSSLDNPEHVNAGKEKLIKYYSALKSLRSGKMKILSTTLNTTDELNPANYIPLPSG